MEQIPDNLLVDPAGEGIFIDAAGRARTARQADGLAAAVETLLADLESAHEVDQERSVWAVLAVFRECLLHQLVEVAEEMSLDTGGLDLRELWAAVDEHLPGHLPRGNVDELRGVVPDAVALCTAMLDDPPQDAFRVDAEALVSLVRSAAVKLSGAAVAIPECHSFVSEMNEAMAP